MPHQVLPTLRHAAWATIIAVLAMAAPMAHAQKTDQVLLRNGDELTGEVKSLASGRLQFKTDATDTIPIQWDHVVSVQSSLFFEVVLSDGQRHFGALHPPEEPGMLRVGTEAAAVEVPLGCVARITRIRESFWKRLKGSIDMGFQLAKANNRVDWSLKLTTNYRTRRGATSLSYDSLYRKQDDTEDLDRQDITFNHRRFFSGKWLAGVFAAGQRNTELALNWRLILGASAGYHIVRTVEQDLVVLAGIAGASETFLDERDQTDSLEAFFGLSYELYALGNRDFVVTASATAFPSLSVKGRFRSEIDVDIRKELWKDFFVSLRGFYSSDSTSGADEQSANSDYGATLGLGFTW
ncbi:MAG: DUF481 domain-containing protein [Acidobacteria bacterium]|nr:DUF481 domain-containing protein [Acidobacteriota bacterium]